MTEEEKSLLGAISEVKHLTDRIKSFESVLEKTNSRLEKLTEAAGEMKAFGERMKSYEERIKSLENSRWWVITFLIGGVLAAVLKTVMR